MTFEEVMGDFRKKISCRLISGGGEGGGGELVRIYLRKISLVTYIMLKKILHRYKSRKKFLTPEVWEKNSCPN